MTSQREIGRWSAGLVVVGLLACSAVPATAAPAAPELTRTRTAGSSPNGANTAVPAVSVAAVKASADDRVNRVVAISVDGLNPKAIRKLGASRAPNFYRLMRQGASTLNARTAREQTRTLPNHTGMLTGRRIDDRRGGHGVTFNSDKANRTVHKAAGRYVASVFDVVHDRGGSTALFTAKKKFALYARTWNTNGAADRVGRNNGRAKVSRFTVNTNNAQLVAMVTAELRRAPRQFSFVHLSLPDEAGHKRRFMDASYLRAVRQTDQLLGQILSTISTRPALRSQTLVVLTADHGGSGATHSKASKLANSWVPFMVWGPGVAAGRNLYSLNPSFRSPGSARTSYSGRQPIRNGDLANVVTDVLDLPRVPGSQFNSGSTLNAFR